MFCGVSFYINEIFQVHFLHYSIRFSLVFPQKVNSHYIIMFSFSFFLVHFIILICRWTSSSTRISVCRTEWLFKTNESFTSSAGMLKCLARGEVKSRQHSWREGKLCNHQLMRWCNTKQFGSSKTTECECGRRKRGKISSKNIFHKSQKFILIIC